MIKPRRLTMQLTPLLDLLLIVIFAQFMDFREKEAEVVTPNSKIAAELERALTAVQRLQVQLQRAEKVGSTSDLRVAKAEADAERYQRLLQNSKGDLDRTLAQHRVLGELVVELFDVPAAEVARILNPANHPTGLSPDELTQLKDKIREMALERSGAMISHLLSYEEIRKRCDVWDLHINAKNIASLDTGEGVYEVRIPFNIQKKVDQSQLLSEFYALYRSLPTPKSLVIVLLKYDRETSAGVTEPMREMLPQWVAQMQADRAGGIRFEYADLGFKIE